MASAETQNPPSGTNDELDPEFGFGLNSPHYVTNDEVNDEPMDDCISPTADVYSYFLLAMPNERRKHQRMTLDGCMAYILVFLTLIIQGVLLSCIYDFVIVKNTRWHNGIMTFGKIRLDTKLKVKPMTPEELKQKADEQKAGVTTGKDWNVFEPKSAGCHDGGALCIQGDGGIFSCAPPSVQLIGRWDELDTNKDGKWTREEAVKSQEDIKCKYAVDPCEIFDVLIILLKEREKYIWIHPDVNSSKAIDQSYFTYVMGDITMCGYRNQDMCGNLVARGVFDAALTGNIPRIGNTVRSALDYCHALLGPDGFCERTLPSTYSTWKVKSVQECGGPEYDDFQIKDPTTGFGMSLLQVDYDAREDYEMAMRPVFMTYKTFIVLIWILLLATHARTVYTALTWAILHRNHPDGDSSRSPIPKIGHLHRTAMCVISVTRMAMLFILLYVGLKFLGTQNDYIGLLLDGVALLFVVQVEELIYENVIRQGLRTAWEDFDPIPIRQPKLPSLLNRPDIADLFKLCFVGLCSIGFVLHYTHHTVVPLHEALECACLSEGEKCQEAHSFSKAFWDQYWTHGVPSAMRSIQKIKELYYPDLQPLKGEISEFLKDVHVHSHH